MHVDSLEARLRTAFTEPNATWRDDVPGARLVAVSTDPARVLFAVDGPATGASVVDAHLFAFSLQARATLAHTAEATPTARAAASRFDVELLDARTLPEPLVADAPSLPAVPEPEAPADVLVALEATADVPDLIEAIVALEHEGEVALAEAAAAPPLLPALDERPPLLAHAEAETIECVPPLPWSVAVAPDEAAGPLLATVTLDELAAMPWFVPPPPVAPPVATLAVAPIVAARAVEAGEPEFEIMTGTPRPRGGAHHPTLVPQLPNWGLPWPRPTAPADGLALHDPSLWSARERVHAMREDLDRAGGSSFGAVRPQGSAWLKRIQQFDGP